MSSISISAPGSLSVPVAGPRLGARATRVRWGRVLALVAALAIVGAGWLALRNDGSASAGIPRGDGAVVEQTPALISHRVVPGDTLWAIASAVDPQGDPRPMVDRIMKLNNLSSSGDVALGEVLLVPSRP